MEYTFTLDELTVLRQSLEVITIQGKNAKLVADLQLKLETLIIDNQIPELPSNIKAKNNQ